MGLELALKFKIRHIEIFGNAELVIKQMTTEYEVRYEGLAMYHDLAQHLFECFPDASITHVPRKDNARQHAGTDSHHSQPIRKSTRCLRIMGIKLQQPLTLGQRIKENQSFLGQLLEIIKTKKMEEDRPNGDRAEKPFPRSTKRNDSNTTGRNGRMARRLLTEH
ncbi:hypothetical protein V6N11_079913 [Hibiscus sabdariffa]